LTGCRVNCLTYDKNGARSRGAAPWTDSWAWQERFSAIICQTFYSGNISKVAKNES